MAARPTTLFGQLRNGIISNNQQRTRNRMIRVRNNPDAPGTPRQQMFRFTRNLTPTRKRKSRGSHSRSRSRGSKRGKSSH